MAEKQEMDEENFLSRKVLICPITSCGDVLCPTNVLKHLFEKHINLTTKASIIYEGRRIVVPLKISECELDKNVCLVSLMYSGYENKSGSLPVARNLCFQNLMLADEHRKYSECMPILVMLCKTHWTSLFSRHVKSDLLHQESELNYVHAIWCAGTQFKQTIYYTIKLYDKEYQNSRSCTRLVRSLFDSPSAKEFLNPDANYMLLSPDDTRILTSSNDNLNMEIILHESPKIAMSNPSSN